MLERYLHEPLVGEVIVVNNASMPLGVENRKIRVLDQKENIFVNPAWNLGVREARFPLLAIANDDLLFDTEIFSRMRSILSKRSVGLVGAHSSCFDSLNGSTEFSLKPAYRRSFGFGTLMFMDRTRYHVIPNELRIWFGDDYIFHRQRRRNWTFHGFRIYTPMSVTSRRPEFQSMFEAERNAYLHRHAGRYAERFRLERRAYLTASVLLARLQSGGWRTSSRAGTSRSE
jgi:hypothetical protein